MNQNILSRNRSLQPNLNNDGKQRKDVPVQKMSKNQMLCMKASMLLQGQERTKFLERCYKKYNIKVSKHYFRKDKKEKKKNKNEKDKKIPKQFVISNMRNIPNYSKTRLIRVIRDRRQLLEKDRKENKTKPPNQRRILPSGRMETQQQADQRAEIERQQAERDNQAQQQQQERINRQERNTTQRRRIPNLEDDRESNRSNLRGSQRQQQQQQQEAQEATATRGGAINRDRARFERENQEQIRATRAKRRIVGGRMETQEQADRRDRRREPQIIRGEQEREAEETNQAIRRSRALEVEEQNRREETEQIYSDMLRELQEDNITQNEINVFGRMIENVERLDTMEGEDVAETRKNVLDIYTSYMNAFDTLDEEKDELEELVEEIDDDIQEAKSESSYDSDRSLTPSETRRKNLRKQKEEEESKERKEDRKDAKESLELTNENIQALQDKFREDDKRIDGYLRGRGGSIPSTRSSENDFLMPKSTERFMRPFGLSTGGQINQPSSNSESQSGESDSDKSFQSAMSSEMSI